MNPFTRKKEVFVAAHGFVSGVMYSLAWVVSFAKRYWLFRKGEELREMPHPDILFQWKWHQHVK